MLTFAGVVVAVPIVFWGTTRLLTASLLLHASRLSLPCLYSYEDGQPGCVAEQGDLHVVVWWKVRASSTQLCHLAARNDPDSQLRA